MAAIRGRCRRVTSISFADLPPAKNGARGRNNEILQNQSLCQKWDTDFVPQNGAKTTKAVPLTNGDFGAGDDPFTSLFGPIESVNSPLDWALRYIANGWAPVPIPYREKGPREVPEWGRLRLDIDSASEHFGDQAQNIGIILGEASGGLVDIDQDCPEACKLAPTFLPPTGAQRWPGWSEQGLAAAKWIVCRLFPRNADMGRHAGRA